MHVSITGFLKPYKLIDFFGSSYIAINTILHLSGRFVFCKYFCRKVSFRVCVYLMHYFSLNPFFGIQKQFACLGNFHEAPGLFSDGFVGPRKIPLAESKSLQLHCYRFESVTTIETSY